MMEIHRSDERGSFRNAWLDARFSFEFGSYRNASRSGYSDLLVLNEDIVAPGMGFAAHPHDNVEVLSFPLSGSVEHRDSTGAREVLAYGDVHLMRAGTGIVHSEMNPSPTEYERHVQWWIRPAHRDARPAYAKRHFSPEAKRDRLCLIAAPDADESALRIDQDVRIYASIVGRGAIRHALAPARRAYVHVLRGALSVNDELLRSGDGAHIEGLSSLMLQADDEAEIVLFDLR